MLTEKVKVECPKGCFDFTVNSKLIRCGHGDPCPDCKTPIKITRIETSERIEECYRWKSITSRLGWTFEGETDFELVGDALNRTKVNLQDLAIIFYTKLARWSDEILDNKIEVAFKEWIEGQHKDAQKMYKDFSKEGRESIAELVAHLEKIKRYGR